MPGIDRSTKFTYALFSALAAFLSGGAIRAYLSIPSDPSGSLLFGLSASRLILTAFPAAVFLLAVLAFVFTWFSGKRFPGWHARISDRIRDPQTANRLLFAALTWIGLTTSLVLFSTWTEVLDRLRPLLVMTAQLAGLGIVFLPALVFGLPETGRRFAAWARAGYRRSVILAFLLALILFQAARSIIAEIGPDVIGWNTTDTPIMDTGLLIALSFIVLVLIAGNRRRPGAADALRENPKRADLVIFLVIWVLAAAYWAALPIQASWYLAGPSAPNDEFSPASDALVYDLTAQNMLVGETLHTNPFDNIVVRRPLYTFFIGLLRTIVGQDYARVAVLQSILLAALPAVVYLAAKQLSGRFAAAVAALLVLLQGGTAIALSDVITVSHAKLLMSDVPSALGVAGFIALVLPWVQNPERGGENAKRLLFAGAVLGGLLLVRFETFLLLPIAAALAWMAVRRKTRLVLPGAFVLTAGLLLVISPWLIRNYAKTGQVYIEVPGNRVSFLINRLLNPPAPPIDETPKIDPMISRQDQEVDPAGRILSHFLHSNVQNILIFPASFRLSDAALGLALNRDPAQFYSACCSGEEYVRRLPFWQWYKWDLEFPPEILAPVLMNLFLFSAGIALAWRKAGWAGLLPFTYGESHILVNAVARTSGGRYLLPSEWIWISYYAAGLLMVVLWAVRLVTKTNSQVLERDDEPLRKQPAPGSLALPVFGLLALGSVLPIGERLYPAVYPADAPEAWVERAVAAGELSGWLDSPNSVILHGRQMYARFFSAEEGALDRLFPSHYFQPYGRLVFFVTGPTSSGIMLPLDAPPDRPIPFGEDVLVIGCRVNHPQSPYTEALAAYFPGLDLLLVRSNLPENAACPLPAPR